MDRNYLILLLGVLLMMAIGGFTASNSPEHCAKACGTAGVHSSSIFSCQCNDQKGAR